jgi:hypothetical protein
VAEIFSGIVCGYALALVVTPLAALAVIRMRVYSAWLRRAVPPDTPLLAWSFIMHSFIFMVLTAVGMVLGLLLYGIEDRRPAGGLGSPNAAYTLLVLAITAIAIVPIALALPRWRTHMLAGGFAFVATFGWIMPYLSLLAPDQS